MEKLISADDVLGVLAAHKHPPGTATDGAIVLIRQDVERLPRRHITGGIKLWDFKNIFAPRETLWLRDPYDGRIVAKDWRRLRRYQNVTVTGCYPAMFVEKDGSSAQCVLVCWGDHDEILAAKQKRV